VIADPLSPRAGGGFGLPAVRRQEINHEMPPAIRTRRARRDHPDDRGLFLNADADNVEPDARRHACASCGLLVVFGAEEVLPMIA